MDGDYGDDEAFIRESWSWISITVFFFSFVPLHRLIYCVIFPRNRPAPPSPHNRIIDAETPLPLFESTLSLLLHNPTYLILNLQRWGKLQFTASATLRATTTSVSQTTPSGTLISLPSENPNVRRYPPLSQPHHASLNPRKPHTS